MTTPPTSSVAAMPPRISTVLKVASVYTAGLLSELGVSTEVVFRTPLITMLALGPAAVLADYSGGVSETLCFCLAGLALIPCAERCVAIY